MGIANIIPGVSGGTIALITNIFDELLNSLKKFDKKALTFLVKFKFKDFAKHTNLNFIILVFGGIVFSMAVLSIIFKILFEARENDINGYYEQIFAFFFGLILASVYYVGIRISKWNSKILLLFLIGTGTAILLTTYSIWTDLPAPEENKNLIYIFICGMVAVIGMLLPGISGSMILMIMGNYDLLMVETINNISTLQGDAETTIRLIVFIIGAIFGLVACAKVVSWLFNKFKNHVLSVLTGFILGSLFAVWPWVERNGDSIFQKNPITGYKVPENLDNMTILCFALALIGYYVVMKIESTALKNEK